MKKSTILIIEDDYDIQSANHDALQILGYNVLKASSLKEGRKLLEKYEPDLIILDILLPDGNGLEYCEEIRGQSNVRIMFLSALETKSDIVMGLRVGGDDYISKPYDMDELVLRVEALLRRGKITESKELTLVFGKLVMDPISRRATLDGVDILLKPKEFSLLHALIESNGQILSSRELYARVWGLNHFYNTNSVKEHISKIRKKLGEESGVTIVTQRGIGYRIEQKDLI